MEPTFNSRIRSYENAFGAITTEQNAKRPAYDKKNPLESLLHTQDLAGFAQTIQALSQRDSDGSSDESSDGLLGDTSMLADHLKNIINQSPADQLSEPSWGSHLGNIIGSLKNFDFGGGDPLLFCIAELLSDESKPWISSEAISKLIAFVSHGVGHGDINKALWRASLRHIQHVDHLSSQAICLAFHHFNTLDEFDLDLYGTKLSCRVLDALEPHISDGQPIDSRMIRKALSSQATDELLDLPNYQIILGAFIMNIFKFQQLGPREINNIMICLSYMNMEFANRFAFFLDNLVPHISRIDDWYSAWPKHFSNIFELLPKLHLRPAVEAVQKAFAMCLSSHDQLDSSEIVNVLLGLQQQEPGEGLEDMTKALIEHIEDHEQFDSDELNEILCQSLKLKSSARIEAIMEALVPHICGVELDRDLIVEVFINLRYITCADDVIYVLNALSEEIERVLDHSNGEFEDEEAERGQVIFLAEAAHILFLGLQKELHHAENVLRAILDEMPIDNDYPIDKKNIRSLDEQRKFIIHLLRNPERLELIDLRDMSAGLAEFYLRAIFNEFCDQKNNLPTLPQLNLIYGKAVGTIIHKKALSLPEQALSLSNGLEINYGFAVNQKIDLSPIVTKTILNQVNFQTGEWLMSKTGDHVYIARAKGLSPTDFFNCAIGVTISAHTDGTRAYHRADSSYYGFGNET